MKTLFLTLLLLSCSHGRDVEPTALERVKSHRDHLCTTFDPQTVTRCDRITFVALMSAACGRDYGLAGYEENGKWHRDTAPCYPQDSKSECSLDGYLSVLHAAPILPVGTVQRMRGYLEQNDWICSPEGPESVTSIRPLKSVIEHMTGAGLVDEADASITGFRGHLLASYIWLKRKVYGSNNLAEKAVLNGLLLDNPRSPFFSALVGDSVGAVANLINFPSPYSNYWGSAPDEVVFAASMAVLENR